MDTQSRGYSTTLVHMWVEIVISSAFAQATGYFNGHGSSLEGSHGCGMMSDVSGLWGRGA
jgi:hypothetical protein